MDWMLHVHTAVWRSVFIPPLDSGYWFRRHEQGNIKPCRTLRIMCGRQLVPPPRTQHGGWSKRKRPGYTSTPAGKSAISIARGLTKEWIELHHFEQYEWYRMTFVSVLNICEKQNYIYSSRRIFAHGLFIYKGKIFEFLNYNLKTL